MTVLRKPNKKRPHLATADEHPHGDCASSPPIVGLREVEQLAAPGELGAVIALFYSLAYSGLAVPYLLALIAPSTGYPQALLFTAAAATLTLAAVFLTGRQRHRPGPN